MAFILRHMKATMDRTDRTSVVVFKYLSYLCPRFGNLQSMSIHSRVTVLVDKINLTFRVFMYSRISLSASRHPGTIIDLEI